MGNTKYISWHGIFAREGDIDFDNNPRQKILDICHGTYLAMEFHEGEYLQEVDHADTFFCIGIVHSYSLTGSAIVTALKNQMITGTIVFLDEDMPYLYTLDIGDGQVFHTDWQEGTITEWTVDDEI